MLDRQDIDALLIGALYGELTPADEARLQAHLESHPTDKAALADLTSARNAVRESRFLTVQLDPPQAVSALLLQEASRRAKPMPAKPEEKESWFQRFVASFARHPAWAAAAMLVLVVGVAGTMYMRGGERGQFAEQTTSMGASDDSVAAPSAAPSMTEEAMKLEQSAGSAFGATLAEPEGAAVRDEQIAGDNAPENKADKADEAKEAKAKDAEPADSKVAAKPSPNRTYIGVETRRPKPMDLDGAAPPKGGGGDLSRDDFANRRSVATGGVRSVDVTPSPAPKADPAIATPSAPPPPPRPMTVTRGGAGVGGASAPGVAQESTNEAEDTRETTWAREQHTKVTNAVRANNCREASQLALALSNRAPAYYTQNVEQDRSLKQCMTYINAEREKEAERQQRARAIQKRNADEADRAKRAAPTTTNTK